MRFIFLGLLLSTSFCFAELPKPTAIPSPSELDIPYSADNPPGPSFTSEEKQFQMAEGQRIRREIIAAFNARRDSYTIAPGNYRFDSAYLDTDGQSFALKGLHGDSTKPFRILGHGATFWFNLTDRSAPHYHQMVKVFDCSHITLEGVTVDSDPRGCMDARITAFDFEGNRIQVKPVVGTRLFSTMPASENRFIPYKSNGHHIASLYQIDSDWGPGNVFYEKMERTTDGHYWFTMKNTKLLDTVRNPEWKAVYGPEGTLEVGDMLGVVYSVSSAIVLTNCKQITVRDCRFHAAKAGAVERGGYGAHQWINCFFMARPGTNNLLGGDGDMSSCMHGPTVDGRIVQRTTDDCFNSHGHWHHAENVTENSITFRKELPPELAQGHTAEAFEIETNAYIGKLTVESVNGKTVNFREPVGPRYSTCGIMFAEFQNAGWVIRNSIFSDCYQRIRLCGGPGIFENNRIERVGSGLTLGNTKAKDTEGGLPSNVVIRDNVFIDSAVGPAMRTLHLKNSGTPLRNLEVSGNLILKSGAEAALVDGAEGLVMQNNIFIHPGQGQHLLPKVKGSTHANAAIALNRVKNAEIKNNLVIQGPAACVVHRETECNALDLQDNQVLEGSESKLEPLLRSLMTTHQMMAKELIQNVRMEIDAGTQKTSQHPPIPAAASAHDHLSPLQQAILDSKSPASEEYRFSFDLPAGPQFTELEKEAQRERGRDVMPKVMQAFESGASEVRIPPGDYRFGQERWQGAKVIFPLGFENMRRDPAQPFVIDASGATFWFDLDDQQMPPGHRCVGFRDCSNIVLRGAIIDRGTRGCIEGRITRIDRERNRFEIQPSPGVVVPTSYKGGDEQRLFPFKSDGRFCAPLYDLQAGVRKLRFKDITPSADGRYWINMLDPDLMQRIHDADWERAFGELGVVRVGDGLSCLYTSAGAIVLEDSANITLHGVSVYVAKGGPSESGGDGAHLWRDCYFGPRPGTSQWKGADGFLCRSTRYGCVMDNVTIRHTADDLQNFHGIWGKVKSVSGKQLTLETNAALRPTLKNARAGDRLRFIHRKTGVLLGEARLVARREFELTLDQDATSFAEAQAEWLDHECAGWVVQNCRWEDNFQRLLIMSGPGTVRGCTFTRMGSNISLNTGMGLVGGIPSDITISDNTFIDVSPRPHHPAIEARGHNAQGQDGVPPIERLHITGNTFTRTGGPAMKLVGIQDSRIERNRIDSPVRASVIAKPQDESDRQAIVLKKSRGVTLKANTLHDPEDHTRPDDNSGSRIVGLEATQDVTQEELKLPDVPAAKHPR